MSEWHGIDRIMEIGHIDTPVNQVTNVICKHA